MKLEYIVKEKDNNMFVKDIIKRRLKVSSRLYKDVIKDIKVNNVFSFATNRVKVGDAVTVNLDNAYDYENMYNKFNVWEHDLDIIYEDEYVLCVNKEAGIPCHPSAMHQEETVYNAVINYYIKQNIKVPIHFVNRLDKDTTGVVIIAKHKYIQEMLVSQMKEGIFNKKYIAVVYGKIEEKEGIIEKNIKRKDGSIILREISDKEGEYAKTGYKVLEYNKEKNYTVLEVKLYTGRTHQIRVHFSSICHPLLGDELYIKESNTKIDNPYQHINRQALHAYEIKFNDINGNEICVKAKLPEDIANLLKNTKL